MMAARRNRRKVMKTGSGQVFPDDLVLEIVARCADVADVIRCAATSKPIRRGILNAPFLRRLRRDGPFIPSLLLGLYHKSDDPRRPPVFVPAADGAWCPPSMFALPPAPNRDAGGDDSACSYSRYLPVASRRSLLVLRRRCTVSEKDHGVERHGLYPVELSVCNPTTGERWVLPPHDVSDTSHAVLDVQPLAPSAFKLLVAELSAFSPKTLYVQIFSSEEGDWGPVLACRISRSCELVPCRRPRPVVLGDTVHWLCDTSVGYRILTWRWRGDCCAPVTHDTSLVKLPRQCGSLAMKPMCLAVSPPRNGAAGSQALLSLIVHGNDEIGVWVRESRGAGSGWELWHCIQATAIPRQMDFGFRWLHGAEQSLCSKESGTASPVPENGTISPLLIDLDSMSLSNLQASGRYLHLEGEFCPYEVDLLSYMRFGMKQF